MTGKKRSERKQYIYSPAGFWPEGTYLVRLTMTEAEYEEMREKLGDAWEWKEGMRMEQGEAKS